jgi:hypothetical protein
MRVNPPKRTTQLKSSIESTNYIELDALEGKIKSKIKSKIGSGSSKYWKLDVCCLKAEVGDEISTRNNLVL